jgi:hypothetical protein
MMRRPLALLAAIVLLVALVPAVLAASPTFGQPTATATYGTAIEFVQPATVPDGIKRVEILLYFPGAAGPVASEVANAAPGSGTVTYRHQLLLADGHLLPNTTVGARWRLTEADGTITIGPLVSVRYDDTRFKWQTRSGELLRVHWYDGDAAFGQRALAIGEKAVRDASALLGVTEKDPIDFFVYADQTAFYDALGAGTRENVGGQADADIRTLFALITPSEINADWVSTVIPHELTHLVFNTAVDNPYHFPPRWLNEGLAVYLSEGYGSGYRSAVADAATNGTLMPLDSLSGQFPTTAERFRLAYGESVSSVDYLVRKYSRDVLVSLIKSYATGLTDDEAFKAAIGVDVAGFDAAWRAELHAKEPIVHGPQPAPPGPLPPGWTDAGGAPGAPLPSTRPLASPSTGRPSSPSPSGGGSIPAIGAGVGLLLAAVAVGLLVARRRRQAPVPLDLPPPPSGWWHPPPPTGSDPPPPTGSDPPPPTGSDPPP